MKTSDSFSPGEPRTVDVAAIEHELARLWETAKPEAGSGVVRAALCNLIVLSGRDDAAESDVAEIAAAVPHRALVVAGAAGADGVAAWISAHCRRTGSGSQVCCEQVTVRAAGAASARVASTLLALLMPDLPVVCWLCDASELEAPLLERLGRHLNRLIVDGRGTADFTALEAWQRSHPHAAVADLEWERLAVWRELVAGSFDGAPFEALLADIATVRIVHGPTSSGAAALFIGWLASRLGWQGTSATTGRDAAGSTLGIECVADAAARDLRSVSITMRDGTRCQVRREAEMLVAKLEHADACALPRVVPWRALEDAAWVVRVLQRRARNVAYAEALAAAARRAGGGGGAAAAARRAPAAGWR